MSGLALALAAWAAEPGFKAEFVGGTLAGVRAKSSARVDLTGADAMIFRCAGQTVSVAYPKIDTLEYGQHVSRRYAAAVLLLVIEQSLISERDISKINIAFMTANGLIGLVFGVMAIADVLWL